MDLAAVRYVVVPRSDLAKISIRLEKYTVAYGDKDVVVYLNRNALARARIVHVAKQASSDSTSQMLGATENGGKGAVYLESAQSVPNLSPCQSSADEVAYELDDPDEVQLKLRHVLDILSSRTSITPAGKRRLMENQVKFIGPTLHSARSK